MRTQLTRGGIALGILVVGLIAGWIGGVSTAHDGAAKIEVYKDWRLACPSDDDKKGSCALASDIADPSSGTHLAQITMGTQNDKPSQQVMVVTVPLTVLIQPGLGVRWGPIRKRCRSPHACPALRGDGVSRRQDAGFDARRADDGVWW